MKGMGGLAGTNIIRGTNKFKQIINKIKKYIKSILKYI